MYLPQSKAYLMKPLVPFAAMRNKKGAIGSPCLKPLLGTNSLVGLPFTIIEMDVISKQALVHVIHL